jgi:hypothetical protein
MDIGEIHTRILIAKSKWKRPLTRNMCRWEENIKLNANPGGN